MSNEEKTTWVYAVVAILVPGFYFTSILGRATDTPVTQIPYVGPMLTAIGVGIVASIIINIVVGMVSPQTAGKKDERDRQIGRRGYMLGFFVFSIMMVAPLIMAMAEAPHFWIANVIYLAFTLTAFVYSVLKIVAYRRGF